MKKSLLLLFVVLGWSLSAFADSDCSEHDTQLISQAMRLMDSGKSDQAVTILDSLLLVYPENNALIYESAYAHHLNEDEATCIARLKPFYESEVIDPEQDELFLMAYSLLGTAYYNSGDIPKSDEVYSKALSLWPDAGLLYYNYGVNRLKGGDKEKALEIFEKGIKNAPKWKSNYRGALSLSIPSGSVAKSIYYITSLVLLDPYSDDTQSVLQLIPELLDSMVNEKDDGAVDITINSGSSSSASDLVMALISAASAIDEDKKNDTKLDLMVDKLKSAVIIDQVLDIPVIEYLKSMESADSTLLDTFWHTLMGPNYPIEFQDWFQTHLADIKALSQWMAANPFPLPKP